MCVWGGVCEVDVCGEVWREIACVFSVVWGVMCQCELGLIGALLFMWGKFRSVRVFMRFLTCVGLWLDV